MQLVTNILITVFFGWPAVIVAVVLAVIGLLRYNYRLLVIAAVVAFPFSWYISGFPVLHSPVFLTPLFLFGAGWATSRNREMLAWILAIPFFLVVLLLLVASLA